MDQQAIQVPGALLTGFLGAGKTTLLNHILSNQQGLRSAGLVNGFGEVGIDHELVEHSNGCICCSINGELQEAVHRVLEHPEPIDLIVVETTGLAAPLPVALTFMAGVLRDRLRLDSIITLIDAEHFSATALESPIARAQVVHGDILLLNKANLVDEQRLAEVEAELQAIKTDARIPELEGFSSVSLAVNVPFDLRRVQHFLDNQLPESVFRAKGVLWFRGSNRRHRFHLCGKRFTIDDSDWPEVAERHTKVVAIGKDLDQAGLRTQLKACVVAP